MQNLQVRLARRPVGIAQADDFTIVSSEVKLPTDGEIMVRNHFLSVEPAMRGWIADPGNYAEPVEIGAVMRALCVGEIIESRHPDWRPGVMVTGWFGWQEVATVAASSVVRQVTETDLPVSLSLGILGINGVTALLALRRIGRPKEGDTVVVSTAAGGVGSAVGQIAKIWGCRTIGITGSADKVRLCHDDFGYDVAFDYHADDLDSALGTSCPNGINIYFDNTSGAISDIVMQHLAIRARVVICGTASVSDWTTWPQGPRPERHLLVKRATMQGFVIFDHADEYDSAIQELANWVRDGKLRYREHVLQGIEACPDSIARLYRGENRGKLLVRTV